MTGASAIMRGSPYSYQSSTHASDVFRSSAAASANNMPCLRSFDVSLAGSALRLTQGNAVNRNHTQSDTPTRHDLHGQYAQAMTVDDFRHNLAAVQARMDAACQRAGRDPATVRLLPVSKTKPEASLRLAYAAGCRMLGENKVQEAHDKWEAMQDLADLRWSVIGHLQTNKAKLVARFAAEFQALDSLRVARALDRHLQNEGRSLDVFVQVNTSGEASKYGLTPDDVAGFIKELPTFSALRVRGLMTLALFSAEAERVRQCFVVLRSLREQLRQSTPEGDQPERVVHGHVR